MSDQVKSVTRSRIARRIDGGGTRAAATWKNQSPTPARAAASQVRAALEVARPDDPSEREAEASAEQVMRMPEPAAAVEEEKPAAAVEEEKPAAAVEEEKPAAAEEEKPTAAVEEEKPAAAVEEEKPAAAVEEKPAAAVEEKPAAAVEEEKPAAATSASFKSELQAARSGGAPLSTGVRAFMEPRFGASFSGVRIHTSLEAQSLSSSIGAKAFTVGHDIFFSRDRYQPGSSEGRQLLAHELTHVIQHGGARVNRRAAGSRGTTAPPAGVEPIHRAAFAWGINGLAASVPGFTLTTQLIGYNPITDEEVQSQPEDVLGGLLGLVPGGEALLERLRESGLLRHAFEWMTAECSKLGLTAAALTALYRETERRLELASLAEKFGVVSDGLSTFIDRVKQFAEALGRKALEFAFAGAIKLAGGQADKIIALFDKGKGVLTALFDDPLGFINNLFEAVKLGLDNFVANLGAHLRKGLLDWLFGALTKAGIQLPETFDLESVLGLLLQVLGLTYESVRAKLVEQIGEETVARAEKAIDFLGELLTRGPIVIWEKIRDELSGFKDQVMEQIRSFVGSRVLREGIAWLVGLINPAAALVKVVKGLVDFVNWLVARWEQISEFANSIFEGVTAIAAGSLAPAAKRVEEALARSVPLAISFFANLLGLGNISEEIKAILQQIRAPIDKAMTRLVTWLVGKARALFAKGKDAVGKLVGWWKRRVPFVASGQSHEVIVSEPEGPIMVASSVMHPVDEWLTKAGEKEKPEVRAAISSMLEKSKVAQCALALAAKNIAKDDPTRVRKQAELDESLKGLAAALAQSSAFGGGVLPPTNFIEIRPKFIQTKEGMGEVGGVIHARPLTMIPDPKHPEFRGTEPNDTSPWWQEINRHRPGVYVQGHLLNQHLHGPGIAMNLAPVTRHFNNPTMLNAIEKDLKKKVIEERGIVEYHVEVFYKSEEADAHPNATLAELALPVYWDAEAWTVKKQGETWQRQKRIGVFKDKDTVCIDAKGFGRKKTEKLKRLNIREPGEWGVKAYMMLDGIGKKHAEALFEARDSLYSLKEVAELPGFGSETVQLLNLPFIHFDGSTEFETA